MPKIKEFWPDANKDIHIDVWREVTVVDNFSIAVVPKDKVLEDLNSPKLFFLNLGYEKELFPGFFFDCRYSPYIDLSRHEIETSFLILFSYRRIFTITTLKK